MNSEIEIHVVTDTVAISFEALLSLLAACGFASNLRTVAWFSVSSVGIRSALGETPAEAEARSGAKTVVASPPNCS